MLAWMALSTRLVGLVTAVVLSGAPAVVTACASLCLTSGTAAGAAAPHMVASASRAGHDATSHAVPAPATAHAAHHQEPPESTRHGRPVTGTSLAMDCAEDCCPEAFDGTPAVTGVRSSAAPPVPVVVTLAASSSRTSASFGSTAAASLHDPPPRPPASSTRVLRI